MTNLGGKVPLGEGGVLVLFGHDTREVQSKWNLLIVGPID
jgi:hypothetical protein